MFFLANSSLGVDFPSHVSLDYNSDYQELIETIETLRDSRDYVGCPSMVFISLFILTHSNGSSELPGNHGTQSIQHNNSAVTTSTSGSFKKQKY